MSDLTFDPFALPSSFDPLAASSPPPPRRRRRAAGEAAPERPPPQPSAEQRLQALEDEVAILKARLDGLEKAIEARLDDQMGRIVVEGGGDAGGGAAGAGRCGAAGRRRR